MPRYPTHITLNVSDDTYNELREALHAAGWDHAVMHPHNSKEVEELNLNGVSIRIWRLAGRQELEEAK